MLKLLRIHQYVKNLFIFLPLFFGLQVNNPEKLLYACVAFFGFSLIASAIYIFNDLLDLEEDKNHPQKKLRPIASGEIPQGKAKLFMLLLLVTGLSVSLALKLEVFVLALLYVVLNLLYSLKLKHIPILDITIIAIGFVLRLFIGSSVTGVELSIWIISMTFLLALFLALAKRRDDVLIFQNTGLKMRKSIDGYNLEFVNAAMVIMAAVVIVFYALYTVSVEVLNKTGSENLYLTVAFVVIGILRYMQVTFVEEKSGSPTEILLKDSFIQLTILAWLAAFAWILYF